MTCNPALLGELLTHPDCARTRFVLIHTGYPHARELVVLAWNTPNVFVDFVWLPLLGVESACQILGEFLEWAPLHKFTMGTDCHQPETTYGAMAQSREVLAQVMARKVELGVWSEQTALDAARAILHDNGMMLYKL
jgi:predicted TIM-barrel fold metal-dependent hydrolase